MKNLMVKPDYAKSVMLIVCVFLLSMQGVQSQVVINELGIAPSCASCNAAGGGEFIELFNAGPCAADISCDVIVWTGLSGGGNPTGWTITIPSGTILAPCAYYVIGGSGLTPGASWSTCGIGGNPWNNPAGTVNLDISTSYNTGLQTCRPGNLVDTQGQVQLVDGTGTVITSVSYNNGNDLGSYPAFSQAPPGCTALNPINAPANASQDVTATFGGTAGKQHGIELRSDGIYYAIATAGTPGSANSTQLACTSSGVTPSNAGSNQTVCATTATLAGNTPASGTGTWSLVSGSGTITTPGSPTSGVTALGIGANVFQWTITLAGCGSSSSQVTITRVGPPTPANAGATQNVCGTTATLSGNTPGTGTGVWSLVSGTGTITTPGSPTSGVTGLSAGPNVFQWTISNSPCASSSAQVTINGGVSPSVSSSSGTPLNCRSVCTGQATVTASGGTGTLTYSWTPSGGTAATTPASLCAGNYTCTVTDNNGCTTTQVVAVTQPATSLSTTPGAITNVNCHGATTGAASISASGGTAGYTYSWTPSGGTGTSASGLGAGTYTCTVTD
ncbi:MAG: hypothetical protein ACHQRM_17355, partial [Bacteroidia bacterium]